MTKQSATIWSEGSTTAAEPSVLNPDEHWRMDSAAACLRAERRKRPTTMGMANWIERGRGGKTASAGSSRSPDGDDQPRLRVLQDDIPLALAPVRYMNAAGGFIEADPLLFPLGSRVDLDLAAAPGSGCSGGRVHISAVVTRCQLDGFELEFVEPSTAPLRGLHAYRAVEAG